MKLIASLLSFGVILSLPIAAAAQAPAQPRASAPAAKTTTRTPDYVEQKTGSDQAIIFTGDELASMSTNPVGGTIRRPPGAIRYGLIRPRLNFVSELLVSVENL